MSSALCPRCLAFFSSYPKENDLTSQLEAMDLPHDRGYGRYLGYRYSRKPLAKTELSLAVCTVCRIFDRGLEVNNLDKGQFEIRFHFIDHPNPPRIQRIKFWVKGDGKYTDWRLPCIEIFTYPDNSAAKFVHRRPVIEDMWTQDQMILAKSWINHCRGHRNCQQEHYSLPTRVIDVINAPGGTVSLHKSLLNEIAPYVALSYCWGGPQPVCLTNDNLSQFTTSIQTSTLPPTILDAIRVTADLGLRYLWVDALCIIQDSEIDKTREIRNMGRIYRQSLVTISANNAAGVGEGFLKARIDDMCNRFKYRFPFADHGEVFGPDDCISVHTIPGSEPLNQRVWTLQESLLPLRSIIFDSYRMTWKCNTEVKSDKRGFISTQGRHNLGSRA